MFRTAALLALTVITALATAQKPSALKGLDPILLIEGKQVQGTEAHALEHRGFRYLFSSSASLDKFKSDPDRYGIQLGGKCVMSDGMDGAPDQFAVAGGRIYLGGMDMCIGAFKADPSRYVALDTGTRKAPVVQANPNRKNVAVLIFPGVQIIDYAGPFEVFGQSGMNPYTVSDKADTITTNMGTKLTPSYTFENAPKPDILLIPGGNVQTGNEAVINWIKDQAKSAEYVVSVCNGAFYLAKAGLLDGKTATTFYGMIDALKTAAPNAKIVSDQRYVDNGQVITTAGLSSGIDGALYVVSKIRGFGAAQGVALNMEYDWKPDSKYARASLADAPLRKMLGATGFPIPADKTKSWTVVRQTGDSKTWTKEWKAELDLTLPELMKFLEVKIAESWTRKGGDATSSYWSFSHNGSEWTAKLQVKETAPKNFELSIGLTRA